jgi:hypothetical protein
VLRDRQELFGPVASKPTTWRVLDRFDDGHLVRVRQARAAASARAWAAGAGWCGSGPGAGPELRHRQHARVEDRIREGTATGLRNFGCHGNAENQAWLEAILTATDLIWRTKLICFASSPTLARCEIAAFRYRVLHVAPRLTHSARQTQLRIDAAWRWAAESPPATTNSGPRSLDRPRAPLPD